MRVDTAHFLSLGAFLMLPLALAAPKGLAPLFALVAVLVLVREARARRGWPRLPRVVGWACLVFMAWALMSAAWSLDPAESLDTGLALGVTLLGGLVLVGAALRLPADAAARVETAFLRGGLLALALLAFELATGGTLTAAGRELLGKPVASSPAALRELNPGASVLALGLWPLAYAARRRWSRAFGWLVLVAGLAVLAGAESQAPLVAALAGLAVLGVGQAVPRWIGSLVAMVVVVGSLAAPLLATALPDPREAGSPALSLSHSAQHRIVIWKATADKIAERPLLGYGLDASRSFYDARDAKPIWFGGDDPEKRWGSTFEPIPLHPHNALLQVWVELGGVGALLVAGMLAAAVLGMAGRNHDPVPKGGALAAFSVAVALAALSFGAWQSWWLAALWLVATIGSVVYCRRAETG